MIEGWAIRLTYAPESVSWAIGIAIIVIGFAIGLRFMIGSALSFYRVPNLIIAATLYLLTSCVLFLWLYTYDAVAAGILWLLTLAVWLAIAAIGFLTGVISHARSVNACGDGSMAWLGIIPIANLFLLFKRPQILPMPRNTALRTVGNILGIILALFIFSMGQTISRWANSAIAQKTLAAESDPERQAMLLEANIKAIGIADSLELMVTQISLGKIDQVTELTSVSSNGTTLIYGYTLSSEVDLEALRSFIISSSCRNQFVLPMLKQGITLEYNYKHETGRELGTIVVDDEICR